MNPQQATVEELRQALKDAKDRAVFIQKEIEARDTIHKIRDAIRKKYFGTKIGVILDKMRSRTAPTPSADAVNYGARRLISEGERRLSNNPGTLTADEV